MPTVWLTQRAAPRRTPVHPSAVRCSAGFAATHARACWCAAMTDGTCESGPAIVAVRHAASTSLATAV
eukprot:7388765-Prymnesium_polylepis.2